MNSNKLDIILIKYNKKYCDRKILKKDNNYEDLKQLIIELLEKNNIIEGVKIINDFCLVFPNNEGINMLTEKALINDNFKLFNFLNTFYNLSINKDFIYKAIKIKAINIIDGISDNFNKFNINFSLNNYNCIQKSIFDFDEFEYLSVFTSIMSLFLKKISVIEFDKARMIFNCFISDAIFLKKWFFLSIILSNYNEIAIKEMKSSEIVCSDFNKCLKEDLLDLLSDEEQNKILNDIKEVKVLINYLKF